ncbi:MAG: PilZ domain-containing protein [Thermodesulfovibrionales bacterium]|nr:PilZ domain-containing protein [Thermodesulfovibrionales bacterium]
MIDRRHFKRFQIENIDVHSRMRFSQDVQILDVSMGGASLSINHPLVKGDFYDLKIEHKDHMFTLNGEVIWLDESESLEIEDGELVSVYKAGLSFRNVFTGKGDRLAELIEEKARSVSQRHRVRGIRVKLNEPKATLELQDDYHVREISFGGIQVEAGRRLDTDMEYRMKMSMPDSKKPIQFIGRIASSRAVEDASPPAYTTGIEFINMGVKDLQRIQELIYSIEHLEHQETKVNLKTSEEGLGVTGP